MEVPTNISATAFVASYGRARAQQISKDPYSRLWVTSQVMRLWEDYAQSVYPHDDLALAIRARFFLERIQRFVKEKINPIFINIASGFASYPFLLNSSCKFIEIDYAHIIEFKKQQLRIWQETNMLPRRDIEFFPSDLNRPEDLNHLKAMIAKWVAERPSYILLEGITYYWDATLLRSLMQVFKDAQAPGSVVAFDFWKPDMLQHPIFLRLENYLAKKFGFAARGYNLLDEDFIASIDGYQAIEITDVSEQEKIFCETSLLAKRDSILEENYAVLQRI